MKRSNAPIFWSLFGAGGMLAALLAPALVVITGFALPFGLLPSEALTYRRMLAFAHHPLGKLFLFLVVALFLWHAVHRIFHGLHDVGVHTATGAKLACYGFAMAGTLLAAYALLTVGF